MTIKPIVDPEIDNMLDEYRRIGGVIDFKLFEVVGTLSGIEAHLLTAQETLRAIKVESDAYFSLLARQQGTNRDDYFTIHNKPITAGLGARVSSKEFFGPCFSLSRQELVDHKHGSYLQLSNDNAYATKGFADAFIEPPHSLDIQRKELEKFFLVFTTALFGDHQKMEVYTWNVDCSTYFDDGKEWWGSFFWTVYNPIMDWYVGVAASTTD